MNTLQLKKTSITFIMIMLTTLSFAQEVKLTTKKEKIICIKKGGNTGCGPTKKDAKFALKMAIENDKKQIADSIAKLQLK